MHAPLRLGHRHALHAVHAAFPFHPPEHAVARDVGDDLLVSARLAFRCIDDLDLPAEQLRVTHVHPPQVAGEQRGFVAAGSGPHFQHDVRLVIDVLGQQQNLHGLLQSRQPVLQLFDLHPCEVRHLGVAGGGQRFGFLQAAPRRQQLARFFRDRAEIGMLLRQGYDLFGLGGRAHAGLDLLEPVEHLLETCYGKGGHGPPFNPLSRRLEASSRRTPARLRAPPGRTGRGCRP